MFYYLIITFGGGLSENLVGIERIEHNALDGVGSDGIIPRPNYSYVSNGLRRIRLGSLQENKSRRYLVG